MNTIVDMERCFLPARVRKETGALLETRRAGAERKEEKEDLFSTESMQTDKMYLLRDTGVRRGAYRRGVSVVKARERTPFPPRA
jgi:hypothetical protein